MLNVQLIAQKINSSARCSPTNCGKHIFTDINQIAAAINSQNSYAAKIPIEFAKF